MGRLGFEPKTNRLKAECSTAELATHAVSQLFQYRENHLERQGVRGKASGEIHKIVLG